MLEKPKKQKSVTALKNKADKLLQLKFLETNNRCIVCGNYPVVGHHVIYKSQSNALRWDLNNLVPLCMGCHTRHHKSGDPTILAKILQVKGQDWFDGLQAKRRTITKINKGYLSAIIEELNGQL